jgi:DNA-binding response OmpR family regulator
MRILVVQEDATQAVAVLRAIAPLNHAVTFVNDGEQAVRLLRAEFVDAVILDWQLPNMSGLELLQWIRAQADATYGVMILTSKELEVDAVSAFEAGADDYVVKPFRSVELGARVNALLRRVNRSSDPDKSVSVGEYMLNATERSLFLKGTKIELTTKEFQLVAILFNNLGKPLSRELLSMAAWGRELAVTSRSLDTHMYRIRQKLRLSPENGLRLSSVYTLGYRLDETKNKETDESNLLPKIPALFSEKNKSGEFSRL